MRDPLSTEQSSALRTLVNAQYHLFMYQGPPRLVSEVIADREAVDLITEKIKEILRESEAA